MSDSARSWIGRSVDELPTPCLVVDEAALNRNIAKLAGYFADRQAKLRPHFKSHKCVTIARRQIAAGACVGITCAKLAEAEALVAGGVDDVLIANQVVGQAKAARLAALNRHAAVRCAVDCADNVRILGQAASAADVTIGVLVEVDVGMDRCGVPPHGPAVDLARIVAGTQGLSFDGLQGYEGHLILTEDFEERNAKVTEAMAPLIETRREIESAGIDVAIVSGGGTGTYDITGLIDGMDEIQAGTYALMDWYYKTVRDDFEIARWVLSTVISSHNGRAVCDVGVKGLGCEFGTARAMDYPEAKAAYTAEEHTPLDGLDAPVGTRVRLAPSHGCTTNNLYSRMYVAGEGIVTDVWAIEARGALE